MYGGISNIGGTTCALNTLIQLITHSKHLYNAMINSFIYDNTSVNDKRIIWHLTYICNALINSHSITPGGLVTLIYELFPDNFHRGEQMDIYELWLLLADKITDEVGTNKTYELLHPKNINSEIYDKVNANMKIINKSKYSPWLEDIQSIQLGVLKCMNNTCGDTPWNVEVYNSLEIDIPSKYTNSNPLVLDQLLLKNYLIEKLPEWKCDKCNNKGGIKQTQIYSLPKILMIVIKRFRMTEEGQLKKINTPLNITTSIKIDLNNTTFHYNLIGIANHYGPYGGGHYNAHVLENSKWICFDDLDHYEIDLDTHNIFIDNKNAYMVCYELV